MNQPTQNFGQIISSLRTKSAANPALIFAALCLAGGVPGALIAVAPTTYFFLGVIALGLLLAASQIIYFTLKDPDRLQDEQHVENKMLINSMNPMLGDSTHLIQLDAEPTMIGNPRLEDRRDV